MDSLQSFVTLIFKLPANFAFAIVQHLLQVADLT